MKAWSDKQKSEWFHTQPNGRELLEKYNKDDAALIRALYVFPEAYEVGQMKWEAWRNK